jgi:hypothetical protein
MRNNAKSVIRQSSVVPSPDWIDLVWGLLIAYANADVRVPPGWAKSYLTAEVVACIPSYECPFERIAHLLLSSGVFGDAAIPPDFNKDRPELLALLRAKRSTVPDCYTKEMRGWHIFKKTSKNLEDQHRIFKDTLKWLCSPKSRCTNVREVEKHLRKFGQAFWDRYPEGTTDRRFLRYLATHGVLEFERRPRVLGRRVFLLARWKHPIDPFCAFLLEQCVGKLPMELPVRFCARPECGRFFAFFRNTAKFCSASCRARSHGTPEKRREYMRRWRLKKAPSPGVQRRKMKKASS